MICCLCEYEARPYGDEGIVGDTFHTIPWELVNIEEYEARKADGRTTAIPLTCPTCYEKYTGNQSRPIADVLHALNEQRRIQEQK